MGFYVFSTPAHSLVLKDVIYADSDNVAGEYLLKFIILSANTFSKAIPMFSLNNKNVSVKMSKSVCPVYSLLHLK